MRRLIERSMLALVVLAPLVVWSMSVGNVGSYVEQRVPPGQILFVFSKLAALLAMVAMWLQLMTAMAPKVSFLRNYRIPSRGYHIALGSTSMAFLLTHVGLFAAASTLRTKHLALQLFVPSFDQGYYLACVSLGAIAFWTMLFVIVGGVLRSLGKRQFRWVHRLSFIAFTLVMLHGYAIGSETRFGLMRYVYLAMAASVAITSVAYLRKSLPRNRGSASAPLTA